jgi:hypothetical protein
MTTYCLTRDSYACLAGNYLVFSDLRGDMYRCLSRENTEIVLRSLPGFQVTNAPPAAGANCINAAHLQRVMGVLSSAGLVCNAASGRSFAPIRVPVPTASLVSDSGPTAPRPRPGHFASFLHACLKASAMLRMQSIRRTVRSVEAHRHRLCKVNRLGLDSMHNLTRSFHRMRPYYGRAYLCRFDSLALIEFLFSHRCLPLWVFGVKCEPFAAHCWVQDDNYILNDSVEYVQRFTPIMAF